MISRILAVALMFVGAALRLSAITIEELAADPQKWPAEVTALGSVRGTIIKDGKPAGAMLVATGRKITVLEISPAGITGKLGATTVRVPIEGTNLWTEVDRLQAGEVSAATVPAAPATPAVAKTEPVPGKALTGPSVMQRRLAGKILRLENGSLKSVDAATLRGVKFYGLYFSASWCGPCRQFTPRFVEAYKQIKQQHPEFEVVFISSDRSGTAMTEYIKDEAMPWLALKYDAAQEDGELVRYGGPGIPCLVLVDAAGVVLSDSFQGDTYLGPAKVLADAQRLLDAGR